MATRSREGRTRALARVLATSVTVDLAQRRVEDADPVIRSSVALPEGATRTFGHGWSSVADAPSKSSAGRGQTARASRCST